jgi:hypothetical protein
VKSNVIEWKSADEICTLGADKGYDATAFVAIRAFKVTPHRTELERETLRSGMSPASTRGPLRTRSLRPLSTLSTWRSPPSHPQKRSRILMTKPATPCPWDAPIGYRRRPRGLRQQCSRAVAQHLGQRIGKSSWLGKLENVSLGHGFAGEVEASNTPTIRRLNSSRRHQLSPITRREQRSAQSMPHFKYD